MTWLSIALGVLALPFSAAAGARYLYRVRNRSAGALREFVVAMYLSVGAAVLLPQIAFLLARRRERVGLWEWVDRLLLE